MDKDPSVVTFSQIKSALKTAGESGLALSELRHQFAQERSGLPGFDSDGFNRSFSMTLRHLHSTGEVVYLGTSKVSLVEIRNLARIVSA